ncbi:OprD family outer membrane porin [Paludibacterium paludis]|uniref:Chitoporin n=1 Tax=Paludibacterium paludis TaxID=1225769 RepID=A0A918UAN9_9NEIS|nr:OprD family outer membrane porin [Paludibacterium paludis]GGY17545.1 chitoporin [Paludibacterium paludis]
MKLWPLAAALALAYPVMALADDPLPPSKSAPFVEDPYEQMPFFSKAGTTVRATWYSRHRTTSDNDNEIIVNALGLGVDWKSGFAGGVVGLDVTANSNLRFGASRGWSEVLYHDLRNDKEHSTAAIGQAAVKIRTGDDKHGLRMRIGYTPVSIGTMGTSGGLHSHAYRGVEGKYQFGDLEVGYGWADRFHNEWDNRYRAMTTLWHQNRGGFAGAAPKIDYVHSLGARYALGQNGFIDGGVGEGKDYRRNAQVAASYTWKLDGADLNLTGYYLQGRYVTKKSGIANPRNEWHGSLGATYTRQAFTWFAGYGQTHAPDSGEMNFRMTAWGNSDNRNFIQTWGQLDDFVWDGTRVVKLGVNVDLGKLAGWNGFSAGLSGNSGTNLKKLDGSTTHADEIDANLSYSVGGGMLKGLSVGLYPARLRTHGFGRKQDRNDLKVIVSYSRNL